MDLGFVVPSTSLGSWFLLCLGLMPAQCFGLVLDLFCVFMRHTFTQLKSSKKAAKQVEIEGCTLAANMENGISAPESIGNCTENSVQMD